jgi:uncharacterized membrane protein YqhA
MKTMSNYFERTLWTSRTVVLVAVVASVLVALGMFYVATLDVFQVGYEIVKLTGTPFGSYERNLVRAKVISHLVESVDGYLLASTMLIFGLGLYELFIRELAPAENSEQAGNVLVIHSLDDLKDRLAKMLLLMLAIKYFATAIEMDFKTPLDMLYLAGGILLIGAAVWLSSQYKKVAPKPSSDGASGLAKQPWPLHAGVPAGPTVPAASIPN